MGTALMGSAPKATFSTQSTINPAQNDLLNALVGILTTGDPVKGVQKYEGTFAEPLNQLQNTSLAGLEQQAIGASAPATSNPQTAFNVNSANTALNQSLNYKAPTIDSTAAFEGGVVQPLTKAFETSVLPAISGQYAGSAGGAYSSGRQQASQQAGANLADTLAAEGSKFAYNAATANQTADLQAQQLRQQALGLSPSITALPQALDAGRIDQLLKTLGGGEIARGVGQTELSGQYGEFTRQQQEEQQIIADFIAAFSAPTQQTIGVGSGGSSGILGGLAGGLGGAIGKSFGSWLFSDERLKDDIELVGEVDGFPLYKYKYVGTDKPRLGFMASDVERRLPHAVARVAGTPYKAVNYGAVIESVLAEAA